MIEDVYGEEIVHGEVLKWVNLNIFPGSMCIALPHGTLTRLTCTAR